LVLTLKKNLISIKNEINFFFFNLEYQRERETFFAKAKDFTDKYAEKLNPYSFDSNF
jgi:hypothetical protein